MSAPKYTLLALVASLPFAVVQAHEGHDHSLEATTSVGVIVGDDLGVSIDADANTNTDGTVDGDASVTDGGGTHTELETNEGIGISVDGSGMENGADLEAYAANVVANSAIIESAAAMQSGVTVTYADEGALFGFISISVPVTISASADGKVAVSAPWYRFLVSDLSSVAVAAKVEEEFSGKAEAIEAAFSADTQAALTARAEILHSITQSIEASVGVE